MAKETIQENAIIREPLPPMASDNPEQIRKDLQQGELSDKLRGLLQDYKKTKRKEVLQKVLSIFGGAFRTLRTKDAAQGIAFMEGLAPKMVGMTPNEKAEAVAPLLKQLSEEEQKRSTEYNKLVSESIKSEKEALKTYLSQLGRFSASQASAIGPQLRAITAGFKEDLETLEAEESGMTADTSKIANNIRKAAEANSRSVDPESFKPVVDPEKFKEYARQQALLIYEDKTIEKSQRAALLKNLRPALPANLIIEGGGGYSVNDAIMELGGDAEQNNTETAQKRSALIADFQNNVRRYWPSTSKFLKDADTKLSNVSANTNRAVSEFLEKNPMDKVFAPSSAARSAEASIKQIQDSPDRAFKSQILKGRIGKMEEAQPYLQAPDGFKDLLAFHRKDKQARRRGSVFKTPASPYAVQGAISQVATDEESDGAQPATT